MITNKKFDKNFIWGVATSATQIEGGALEDGRGLSIWDVFSRIPSKVYNNQTADVTNDFYHRYVDDIKILKDLGVNSFRMSLSWSRIIPNGKGSINQKGLYFYHKVIDELLKNDIMPNVTLYHWDLPYALQEELGWINRDVTDYFANYSKLVFSEFADKVPYFATINEPIATFVGYGMGVFAPGIKGEKFGRMANHNILLAHGKAVEAFRATTTKSKLGIVIDIWNKVPLDKNNEDDIKLASHENEISHLGYINPIFKGKYSDYHLNWMQENNCMPQIEKDDLKIISQPLDYFGCNCYSRVVVSKEQKDIKAAIEKSGGNFQQNNQEFYPKAIYDAIMMMKNNFIGDLPIIVTENGTYEIDDNADSVENIDDEFRIKYLSGFINEIARAKEDGANVLGYYAWSLYDNWEWTAGTSYRFGLLHNDFKTQKRTWKKSAHWYKKFIEEQKNN